MQRTPVLLAAWQTALRRHDFYSGLVMEQGNSYKDGKGKAQPGRQPGRLNTDDLYEDRLSRSSDETPVMGAEPEG